MYLYLSTYLCNIFYALICWCTLRFLPYLAFVSNGAMNIVYMSFQISFMKRCDTQEKRLQIPRPEWSAELECMIIACASIYDKCIDN